MKLGYKIVNWEKNDPGIVPFPVNIEDQSKFGDMFLAEWSRLLLANNTIVPVAVRGTVTNDQIDDNQPVSNFHLILEEQNQRYENGNHNVRLHEIDQQAEPNPWLNRVGYDVRLSPYDRTELKSLAKRVEDNDVQMQRISTRLTKTLWNVIQFVKSIDKSNPCLFHVNRICDKFPIRPFNAVLLKQTWERYIGVVMDICIIVFRLETAMFEKPQYTLSDGQQGLIHQILNDHTDDVSEMAYVDFLLSLIWQKIAHQSYDCIFLNAIAIMSIKDDSTYLSASDTTPIYAAILAVFKAVILNKAKYFQIDEGTPSNFQENVIHLVKEMLMHPSVGNVSGPISWILNSFAFARVISQNMKIGDMFWEDDTLNYGLLRVSLLDLQTMIQQLLVKAKRLLVSMFCCDGIDENERNDCEGNSSLLFFPVIQWNAIYDDIQNKNRGYSFLNEPKNNWLISEKQHLFQKIKSSNSLSHHWFDNDTHTLSHMQIDVFGVQMENFREILLGLIHCTAGQPARGTEITNITFENGISERNIFIERNMVCIRTV